ncbi:MAG: hypothetical protein OEY01_11045 [Desulfobulbaceae bacterium]|nr:hypothetical protein [Desulfobulbaceae bacterium]
MKLLSLTITKVDSTSFYRANGVFGDLQRKMPDLHITSMDVKDLRDMNWSDLNLFDVIFMQRPYSSINYQMARFVKDMNLPLWIDFDDNLFEIPTDNRAFDTFANPTIRKNIEEISKLADLITTSTGELAGVFSKINPNTQVIPNALNTQILQPRPKKQNNTVLWRGSDTHQMDIFFYADQMFEAQSTFADFDFIYFGYNPWIIPATTNKKHIKTTDPIIYFQQLNQLAPKIMQVPLVDSHFNRCKSNIAYLEATYAGAVCLVPDWPEWDLPGTVRYNSPEEYAEKLKLLLTGGISFNKYNRQAWEYILEHRTLETVNTQRAELLTQLTAHSPQLKAQLL